MAKKTLSSVCIGVLALQGDFREHILMLSTLGVPTKEIRHASELDAIDALILPGGESTAVAILESAETSFTSLPAKRPGIFDAIREKVLSGMPTWGTCMGSILLAKQIEGSVQGRIGVMDIVVRRNAFGPQRASSEIPISIPAIDSLPFPGVFIRAPLICSVGANVEILSRTDEGIIMAQEQHMLATVFHPEVVNDDRVHRYFLTELVGVT
ncbi:MAG: pyridoxal 5'-phosphate synthase glutaminase subunit PdxT [Candidatus Kapaibacterium sp.]|jgi:5'-phosphate synthase pdxT subunit